MLPDFASELDVSLENAYSLNYLQNNTKIVEFFSWQEQFDQHRRRQKPESAGVLLKIRREVLDQYLIQNNFLVCYIVELNRTVDVNKLENKMTWNSWHSVYF